MMADTSRQTERTRQAIRSAFVELLFERGFARLTITDVIVKANVGRSTFYEHYRTKLDLLRQSLAGLLHPLASIIAAPQPPAALVPLLLHIRENQALGRELFTSVTRILVTRLMTEQIEQCLFDLMQLQPTAKPIIPLKLIAVQLAQAQFAMIEEWSLGRIGCPVEQLAQALCVSSHAATMALLGRDSA